MSTLLAPFVLVYAVTAQQQIAAAASERFSCAQSLSPDGKELAFQVDDGTVRFLALADGKVRLSVPGFAVRTDDLAWSPGGEVVAAVARDGLVRIIRATDGHVTADFSTSPEVVSPGWRSRTIDFVDGGTKLLLAGGNSAIQLREHEGGKLIAEFLLDSRTGITAGCVSRDRLHFAAGDRAGSFAVYSAKTGKLEAGPFRGPGSVNALAFDPEGTRLAVGSGDCRVRVVPLRGDAAAATLSHCDLDVFGHLAIGCVEFSPDGKKLLATSFSIHEVRLWDLATGSATWRYDYGGGNPAGVAARFTPDPSMVVVWRDGLVFDAATGKVRHELAKDPGVGGARAEGFYAWTTRDWSGSKRDPRLRVHDVRDGKLVADVDLADPTPR